LADFKLLVYDFKLLASLSSINRSSFFWDLMISLPLLNSLPAPVANYLAVPEVNYLAAPEVNSLPAPEVNSLAAGYSLPMVNCLISTLYSGYFLLYVRYCQLGMMTFFVTMATSFYFY
jgi:hypothetical protein